MPTNRKPSEKEREATRKKLLAAEAVFLLLLLRASRQRNRKAAVAQAILQGSLPIRRLARERLAAELRMRFGPSSSTFTRDARQRAATVAARFSDFVGQQRVQLAGVPAGQSEQALRRQTENAVQNRLRQIATTESVRAFEEERREALDELGDEMPEGTTKVWDALMDACEVCSQYDGREIALDDEFPEGDPPLHPNCRCSLEYRLGTKGAT